MKLVLEPHGGYHEVVPLRALFTGFFWSGV